MMKVSELLILARAKIADRAHWTQSTYAKDQSGGSCDVSSVHAFSFCGEGALRAAVYDAKQEELLLKANRMLDESSVRLFGLYVPGVNDRSEPDKAHANVLKVYDDAILVAQALEQEEDARLNLQAAIPQSADPIQPEDYINEPNS